MKYLNNNKKTAPLLSLLKVLSRITLNDSHKKVLFGVLFKKVECIFAIMNMYTHTTTLSHTHKQNLLYTVK